MVRYEIQKHINRFTVIFVSVMFLMNLAVILVQYISHLTPESRLIQETKAELFDEYRTDNAKFTEEYNEYLNRKNEYEIMQRQSLFSDISAPTPIFVNKKIDLLSYGDIRLYGDIMATIEQSENYKANISKLLYESYSRIKETGIQRGLYVYEYQVGVIARYEKLLDLDMTPRNQYGWNEFFTLKTPVIFLAITFLGVFVNIFIVEKRTKITNILHICRKGGKHLKAAKLCAVSVFSASLTLLFTLSPLLILSLTTGLSSPSQYIQAVSGFEYCPYALTIWQYMIIFTAVKLLVFLVFAMLISVMGQISGSEAVVFGGMLVFIIISFALTSVGGSSPVFFMKKFSFFETAFVNVLFDRYRALNIFGFHVNFIHFTFLLVSFFLISLVIFSIAGKINSGEYKFISVITKKIKAASDKFAPHGKRQAKPVIAFELYKNFLNPRYIAVIAAAAAVKIIISGIYYAPAVTNQEQVYKQYMSDLFGEVNEQKDQYIAEEQEYISKSIAEYDKANEDYRSGGIELAEFREYSYRYNYANFVSLPFQRVTMRYSYLQGTDGKYDNIWFIYEYGAVKYLFPLFDVVLVIFFMAVFSNLFAGEYQSNFSAVLRLTKYGRHRTFNSKYIVCVITVAFTYLMFSAVDLLFLFRNYDINYLNAGIMSIPELQDLCMNISILQYMILYKAVSLFGFILFALIAASLSNITGHVVKASVVMLFAVTIPFLLENFGIGILSFANITNILIPTIITRYIPQYVFYTAVTVGLCVWSKRKWT